MEHEFENVRPERGADRHPDCPELTVWYEVAGGATPPDEALYYLDHVSGCDYCRPRFREAVADLNEETTAAEAKQIAALDSARAEWQRQLVRKIMGKNLPEPVPVSRWRRWTTVPRLALAAAGLVVAIVGYRMVVRPSPIEQTGKLLATAYGERRTLEFRMSGMPHAVLAEGMLREGESASFMGRSGSLLEAEALIHKQLAAHPSDPRWLHAKARADLMEGKYKGAVDSLTRASQLSPDSPEILIDLATALSAAERYEPAYERLSKVLALQPDNAIALFNRAMVADRLHLYHQVLDDADRYLQLDSQSKWADEMRNLAANVRAKLKEQEQSRAAPLLSPAQLAASLDDPALRAQVDQRVEEYLKEAVVTWLPRAFPDRAGKADPAARQALFFLADLTRQQHNDLWLSDLLQGSSSGDFPRAVGALSRAIQANADSEFDTTTAQGGQAERWFQATGNIAGALRARFEQVYAAHFQQDRCRIEATAAESERHAYPWLQTQIGLEKAVCSIRKGDIGGDERLSRHAMERAKRAGYGEVYLRALFFAADDARLRGDPSGASKLASAGLERFWSGHFPAMQGYNLYGASAYAAEAADQPQLTYARWREAVALIDSNQDLLLRAGAHQILADSAMASGFPLVAQRHYTEAAHLYALAPKTKASQADALENEIRSAQLEAHLGRYDAATERLISIQDQVRPLTNTYLLQMFYDTLGELQLARHQVAEAQQALRPALVVAEQNLTSIHSEAERIRWARNASSIYLGMAEAELVQGRPQESLEIFEWYQGAPLREPSTPQTRLQSSYTASIPSPSRLAARLPALSQETVIAYGLLPGGLAIWVYDDRGVSARWIPKPAHDLQELVARFSDLTSDPHSELSAVRRDARSLYQALIAPVEERLVPGRALVIEADGLLARVPFEALLDPAGHYLVERWPIVHSLGQDVEARLRESSPVSADWPALVVGSTATLSGGEMISLPNVGAEADTVARGFRFSRNLKGGDATFSAVRSELATAALFHFAGHSLTTPERDGLLLEAESSNGDPVLLDADTLRRLPAPNLRLAVLSACGTASGNEGSDDFGSVMEALLRAGVPHVVASRWAVDSVQARVFVEDFYRNALSGQPVSNAIRLTSRKMLSDPRTAHPYYWSAFAAYGRP